MAIITVSQNDKNPVTGRAKRTRKKSGRIFSAIFLRIMNHFMILFHFFYIINRAATETVGLEDEGY